MIEIVFTCLQRRPEVPNAEKFKGEAVADYVVAAEDSGDTPARCAMGNIHKNLLWAMTAIGPADLRIQPASAGADGRNYQKRQ